MSIRTPPTLDTTKFKDFLVNLIEENPPYNATVEVNKESMIFMNGWNAADLVIFFIKEPQILSRFRIKFIKFL